MILVKIGDLIKDIMRILLWVFGWLLNLFSLNTKIGQMKMNILITFLCNMYKLTAGLQNKLWTSYRPTTSEGLCSSNLTENLLDQSQIYKISYFWDETTFLCIGQRSEKILDNSECKNFFSDYYFKVSKYCVMFVQYE